MRHVKNLLKAEKFVNDAILSMLDADEALENEMRLEETDEFCDSLKKRSELLHHGIMSFIGTARTKQVQGSLFGEDDARAVAARAHATR